MHPSKILYSTYKRLHQKKINNYNDLIIKIFQTSAVVQGEYHHAMNSVKETILVCQQEFNNAVYVMKVIPNYKVLD